MVSRAASFSAPLAVYSAAPPLPTLHAVQPATAAKLGSAPRLPVFIIQNDAVDSLKCTVETEEDAWRMSRVYVRKEHLDPLTLQIVRTSGYTGQPFPLFLYVRALGQWTMHCQVQLQVETDTHFILECVACHPAARPQVKRH